MKTITKLLPLVVLCLFSCRLTAQVTFGTADTAYVWQDIKNQFDSSADNSSVFLLAEENTSPATLSNNSIIPANVTHWHLHFSMMGAFTAYNYLSLYLAASLNSDGSVAEGLCVRMGGTNNKTVSLALVNANGNKQILCESPKNTLRPNVPFSVDIYRKLSNDDPTNPEYSFSIYCDINNLDELVCETVDKSVPASYFSSHPTTAIEITFTKTYANGKTLICDFMAECLSPEPDPLPVPEPEPTPEPEPQPEPQPEPEPEPQPEIIPLPEPEPEPQPTPEPTPVPSPEPEPTPEPTPEPSPEPEPEPIPEPEPAPEPEPQPQPIPEPVPEPQPVPAPADYICKRGDIVINEIMYHPSSDLDLPEIEWVELYNTTDTVINLSQWQWTSSAIIPPSFIEPHGFIILCAKKYADELSEYAECQVYPTSSWPTLNNTAKCLYLSDNHGRIIDYVYYYNSYFKGDYKADGGWSLERIDPENQDGSMDNWSFSLNDFLGATPGYTNSVYSANVDTTPPHCLYALMSETSPNTIRLYFSEPMDTINIPSSIGINDKSVDCSLSQADRYNQSWLDIRVNRIMEHDTYYSVSVADFHDLAGNNMVPEWVNVGYADSLEYNDVVINEIMSKASPASMDYLELYNRSNKNIDLYSLCVASLNDDNSIKSLSPVLSYHRILFPNEYLVVTKDSLGVIEFFSPENPQAIINSPKFPALPAEGAVAITTRNGSVIDLCIYNNSMHSPLSKGMPNVSLERIHPFSPSSELSNWSSASELAGYASPTARNSQYHAPTTPSKGEIEVTTKIFTPYSATKPDRAVISTLFTDGSWYATFQIYAPNGHLITTLYNNTLLPTSGELTWDGRDSSGQLQPPGTYVIYISAWQTAGKTTDFKSTVILQSE